MKVLSDRTAADLVRLLRERHALPSRPIRIAHGGGGGRREPFFLECRAFKVIEDDLIRFRIKVFMTPGGRPPPSFCINGKPCLLWNFNPAALDADGWLDLGWSDDIDFVWAYPYRLPDPSGTGTYYGASNWITGAEVQWAFDTTGDNHGVGVGVEPIGAPTDDWPRWLHPVLICEVRGGGGPESDGPYLVQCVHCGMDISAEIPDGDHTHSGTTQAGPGVAGGFCSLEQNGLKQLQLYDFRTGLRVHPTTGGMGEYDLVLRQCDGHGEGQSPSRAIIRYMVLDELLDYLRTQWGDDFAAWLAANAADLLDILADQNLRDHGPFWASGGDHTTCYGNDIADMVGNVVIDLANRVLQGAWKAVPGAGALFQVDGNLDVTGQAVVSGQIVCNSIVSTTDMTASGNISAGSDLNVIGHAMIGGSATVTGDATVGGDAGVGGGLTVTGDISGDNFAASGDVRASGKIIGAGLEVGGNVYVPAQITYTDGNGNPQTITVLKKQ